MTARLRHLLLCMFILGLIAASARADDPAPRPGEEPASEQAAQARAFFDIGAEAYEKGDYTAALQAFNEAYSRVARPGLLFSMAQAHRRAFFATNLARHLQQAVEHYRKYLESGDSSRRRDAEEALATLVPLSGNAGSADVAAQGGSRAGKLMIASPTPGVTLHVDGARAPHLPHVATVEPGMHTLTLSAPGFRRETRRVPVPEGAAFAFDLPLQALPGALLLHGSEGTQVILDGRAVGVLPLPPLPLTAGTHQVSLRRIGHRVSTRILHVERGETERLQLPLERTPQRYASYALVWAGGLGLLTSGVLAGAAHARQVDARKLLKVRKERPISSLERDKYTRMVATRDALRTTAVSLAGGAALSLLIGAALYTFDLREAPPFSEQGADPSRPERKSVPSEVIAGPVWDGDQLGVVGGARF